jgi:hypothetical protein
VKWPRNGFVEMGFFERKMEMEMEMGWRIEERVRRRSREAVERIFSEERGESWRKKRKMREREKRNNKQ